MKEIIEYTVVYGNGRIELIDNVNRRISSGWQPFSDITTKFYPHQGPDWYQPMVKYKPEPKNSI